MNNRYVISMVPDEYIHHAWETCADHIDKYVRRMKGRCDPDELLKSIIVGKQTLWVVLDREDEFKPVAFFTVCVYDQGSRRCCRVENLGGVKAKEWFAPFHDVVIAYGKDMQCDTIEFVGRPGWEKFVPDFKKASIVMELEV